MRSSRVKVCGYKNHFMRSGSYSYVLKTSALTMGRWSATHAMEAYLHTVQLCKEQCYDTKESKTNRTSSSSGAHLETEPKTTSMEFLSALAAGNQARLLVDVGPESGGASPATAALAVAAKQTPGGRLICIRRGEERLSEARRQMQRLGLAGAVAFERGEPRAVVERLEKVDFAVVDSGVEGCAEVLEALDMNPRCSAVVVTGLFGAGGSGAALGPRVWYGEVARGRGGRRCESMVLPIGEGMEVTRIGGPRGPGSGRLVSSRSNPRRTFWVYDESPEVI